MSIRALFTLTLLAVGFTTFPQGMHSQESQQQVPDWQNPAVVGINREAPHATVMPYQTMAQARAGVREQSPYYRSLSGQWSFAWSRRPSERPSAFYEPDFSVADWPQITVPGNWQLQG